jgi:hypothetical protein
VFLSLNLTQKIEAITEFTLVIGIDVGSEITLREHLTPEDLNPTASCFISAMMNLD